MNKVPEESTATSTEKTGQRFPGRLSPRAATSSFSDYATRDLSNTTVSAVC
jgi:hypothetical protein